MKPVRLATCRNDFEDKSRRLLVQAARLRPQSVAILIRVDGELRTAVCGMNRLELLGALQMLEHEVLLSE